MRSAITGRRSPGRQSAISARHRRLERRSGDEPPQGHRSCAAGAPGGGRRPGHPRNAALRAGLFRRGYRRHDGAGRPCACAQPELRPRLVTSAASQALGRPTRSRDRAFRDLAAPEPARPYGPAFHGSASAHFFKRQFDEAASNLLLAIQEDPGSPGRIAFSRRAMPIWGSSTKRERLSRGCAPSPL